MDKLRRLLQNKAPEPQLFEEMTAEKVDFNFQVYWTKMVIEAKWSTERRVEVREQVQNIVNQEGFQNNLINKQYELRLADIPEQKHSGASLLMLLKVLNAFDSYESE